MLRSIGFAAVSILILLGVAWSAGAIYFDLPLPSLMRMVLAIAWLLLAIIYWVRGPAIARFVVAWVLGLIVAAWLMIPPSNERPWQADVAELPWTEIKGDVVTIHNYRNFDYRSETDYTPHWETKVVNLSTLKGVDAFLTYWSSPYICHPILSFRFGDNQHVVMSIETRKELGEDYSTLGGFYRQYELIYLVGDERDFIRLRTNYRKGEEVYLYKLNLPLATARERFLEYCRRMNELKNKPRWYNALTANCTTSIYTQREEERRAPFDWRLLVNGKLDELLYQHGGFDRSLPLEELRQRGHINARAKAADKAPDFSRLIRVGVPGY